MTILEIKLELLRLPLSDRQLLLSEIHLKDENIGAVYSCQALRRESGVPTKLDIKSYATFL